MKHVWRWLGSILLVMTAVVVIVALDRIWPWLPEIGLSVGVGYTIGRIAETYR